MSEAILDADIEVFTPASVVARGVDISSRRYTNVNTACKASINFKNRRLSSKL